MKLIGSHTSPFVRKVRIVLAEKKIEYDFEIDSPWLEDSNVPNINPLGKIPVLLLDDETSLASIAAALPARFEDGLVLLDGDDVTEAIRSEACSVGASRVAVLPAVRDALFWRQRSYRTGSGLVAEGRDMGSVIFPDAGVKIFLTASVEARAERRYKQLIDKGMAAKMDDLLKDLYERDARDSQRAVAPLKRGDDAVLLDTSGITVQQAVDFVIERASSLRN
jgi:3-phosphoshikimate 1-carboxyvinyltransferase